MGNVELNSFQFFESSQEPTMSSTIIPCLRYRDAQSAIEWLCKILGFEKRAVYPNPDGKPDQLVAVGLLEEWRKAL